MTIEKWLRLVAGVAVLISITLGLIVNHWWFAFTAFVGVNLLQSGFTNWCPVKWALERMGVPPCA
jgi:hypothetical protein